MMCSMKFALLDLEEQKEREGTVCCGCGGLKDVGCIVCWHCFKAPRHPYKTWDGTLAEWIAIKGAGRYHS